MTIAKLMPSPIASAPRSAPRSGPGLIATCCLVASVCLIGLTAVLASALPDDADAAAAVFPPWWTPARVIEAAGSVGDIIRFGETSFVVVVASDSPSLKARLRRAGALLLLDPVALSLCQPRSSQGVRP